MLSCKQGSKRIGAEGRFELTGELGSDLVLLLMAESRAAGEFPPGPISAHAWPHVTEWADGEERVLAAPEFRNVRVRVEGIPLEHRDATLRVLLRPPVEGTELTVSGVEQTGRAVRELRFHVAIGRRVVTPYCPLHPMEERTIDVPSDEGEFVVDSRARRAGAYRAVARPRAIE